jgi:glutamine cyclotransferase
MKRPLPPAEPAEIVREYGPYAELTDVAGVTFDGERIWAAGGDRLHAIDPDTGELVGGLDVSCHAGTAFDGRHLFQIDGPVIRKLDPRSGRVLATIPSPGPTSSGLTWAEGSLWVGQYRDRKILRVDPQTGAVLQTIDCDRFVTGVTWVDGELWHGADEEEDRELRRVDPRSGEVIARLRLPEGAMVSGLESDGADRFYAGGGRSGRVRAIRRPKRAAR